MLNSLFTPYFSLTKQAVRWIFICLNVSILVLVICSVVIVKTKKDAIAYSENIEKISKGISVKLDKYNEIKADAYISSFKGLIIDRSSLRPLPNVFVQYIEYFAETNEQGEFELSVNKGDEWIITTIDSTGKEVNTTRELLDSGEMFTFRATIFDIRKEGYTNLKMGGYIPSLGKYIYLMEEN